MEQQRNLEKDIRDAKEIPEEFKKALDEASTDAVIFGEIYDDVMSGEYKITATVEAFSGVKLSIQSVMLRRGKVFDAESRRESMEVLAQALCPSVPTMSNSSRTSSPIPISPWERPTLQEARYEKFLFALKGCSRSSARTVTCYFIITNEERDRTLTIHGHTKVFDNLGNENDVAKVELADRTSAMERYSNIQKTLISGVPVRMSLTFEGFSPQANQISLLYFSDALKFRDISVVD